MRRSRRALEQAVAEARTPNGRAFACYALGLFHDNNDREAAAIPWYREALTLDLDAQTTAKARAWLASSLYKTGQYDEALITLARARRASAGDETLTAFLRGLEARIRRVSRPE